MKNTKSILENIKKIINKFEEPRDNNKKDFSDLNDEFEYIGADNKKEENVNNVNENAVSHDVIFEHEIENSFPDDLDFAKDFDKNDQDEELQKSENDLEEKNVSVAENENDEDLNFDKIEDDLFEKGDDLGADLNNNPENKNNFEDEDHHLEQANMLLNSGLKKEVFEEEFENFNNNKNPEEVSDDENEDLVHEEDDLLNELNVEQNRFDKEEILENNIELPQDFLTNHEENNLLQEEDLLQEDLPQEEDLLQENLPQNVENEDMNDFLSRKNQEIEDLENENIKTNDLAGKVSQSIKKLVDAKNIVKKIENYDCSDDLNLVAQELMKPKIDKWLENNLPQMVEKIVKEEIKKIISNTN